jgi:hypothetical protein
LRNENHQLQRFHPTRCKGLVKSSSVWEMAMPTINTQEAPPPPALKYRACILPHTYESFFFVSTRSDKENPGAPRCYRGMHSPVLFAIPNGTPGICQFYACIVPCDASTRFSGRALVINSRKCVSFVSDLIVSFRVVGFLTLCHPWCHHDSLSCSTFGG